MPQHFISSVQLLSCVRLFVIPWTAACQAFLSIINSQSLLKFVCPSNQWCHPTILSSVVPFSSCLQSFPASGPFPKSQFFSSGGQSIGASTSASVPPMNIQGWLLLGCCPRDTRESSPAQFESINSLVLDLNGPTVTSVQDYWKSYSSITDLCLKSFDQVFKQANLPQTLYFFDGLICEYETMKIWRLWRIFSVGS